MTYMNQQFDPSVTWKEAKEIASLWGGPFAIKGLMSPDDAEKAIDSPEFYKEIEFFKIFNYGN